MKNEIDRNKADFPGENETKIESLSDHFVMIIMVTRQFSGQTILLSASFGWSFFRFCFWFHHSIMFSNYKPTGHKIWISIHSTTNKIIKNKCCFRALE